MPFNNRIHIISLAEEHVKIRMNVNNNEAYMTILLKNQKQYYGAKIDIETGLKDSGFSATFTFIKHITKNSTENEITYDLTHYKTKQT